MRTSTVTRTEMILRQSLSKIIRKELDRRNWTSTDLSHATGLDVRTIQKILSCSQGTSMPKVARIAKALKIKVRLYVN